MKRVLAIYYSQTGQLGRSMEAFLGGLDPARFEVREVVLRPRTPHPFPWSLASFFDVFPETFLGLAPPLQPLPFDPDEEFDLIVLGYTVWFLRPSLPVQAFFDSEHARVLRGRPVVTLIACRNMWYSASERMKRMLAAAGAHHLDNVVVTDQGPAWATFVTTPRWMLTGRKDPFWFFPAAGVAGKEIEDLDRFGRALSERIDPDAPIPPGPLLGGLGAARVDAKFILPELIGCATFALWSRILRAAGRLGGLVRRAATFVFVVNLVAVILVLIPASIVVRIALYPLLRGWFRAYTARLLSPSGGPAVESADG